MLAYEQYRYFYFTISYTNVGRRVKNVPNTSKFWFISFYILFSSPTAR